MQPRRFHIAKINISQNIFSQNLNDLISIHIPRVIMNPETLRINSWNWSFTDVEQTKINNIELITGNVTKSKKMKQKIKDGSHTREKQLDHETAMTSFFIYEPQSELLVYEVTGSITSDQFIQLFTKLLSRDVYVGAVVIKPLTKPFHIKEAIYTFDKVTQIEFNLIHPNPFKEEFNLYQDIIDANNLKHLNIEMENRDGIKIQDDDAKSNFTPTIENGIALVEKGYGDIQVKGFNEIVVKGKKKNKITKKKKSFSSAKSQLIHKTKENSKPNLLKELLSFILSVKLNK
ncbi:hypothetical protein JF536_11345 [Priestia flexa]|uniref:hypothetical protein n=1 Tax=Priestia flexa TaxID=86664 RepID=UPI001A8EB38E|nr:hypothetical protein [Priestia flexa]MBN8434690.1 hypothetical protein [Priestia flexa]MCA0967229.1 hypothetical protein [Priestia flexa]